MEFFLNALFLAVAVSVAAGGVGILRGAKSAGEGGFGLGLSVAGVFLTVHALKAFF